MDFDVPFLAVPGYLHATILRKCATVLRRQSLRHACRKRRYAPAARRVRPPERAEPGEKRGKRRQVHDLSERRLCFDEFPARHAEGLKRRHLKRVGTMAIHNERRADMRIAHQICKTCDRKFQFFGIGRRGQE